MRTTNFYRVAVVALVAGGILCPHSLALADNTAPSAGFSAPAAGFSEPASQNPQIGRASAAATTPAVAQPVDVTLIGGELHGRLVDGQGQAVAGAVVDVQTGNSSISQTSTDAQGQFSVKGLKGGTYRIAAGNETRTVRAWTERTAPPAAKSGFTMVAQSPAVRGQFGGVTPGMVLLTSGVVAGVVLGSVAVSQNDDIKNQNNQILNQLNQIPKTP